jgi:cytidylate kinase
VSPPVKVVAIDGPAASGKSTVARLVARRLGFIYVDSGAMYRTVTWQALEQNVEVEDTIAVIALLHRMRISFEIVNSEARMLVNGVFPGDAIRQPRVTERVSVIAAIPEVRHELVAQQRALTRFGSLVMEGRDIGSVVFPDTPHKFYLDADPEVRAARRQRDFQAMQIKASPEGVAQAIRQRDRKDSNRPVSPLQIALGAAVIDNSRLDAEATAELIIERLRHEPRAGSGGD